MRRYLPEEVGNGGVTGPGAVSISEKFTQRPIGPLVVTVSKASVFEKLLLSTKFTPKGGNTQDQFTSVPMKPLASIADHRRGMGYPGGKQLTAIEAESTTLDGVDERVAVEIDIGRFNLREGDHLEVVVKSSADLVAGETVKLELAPVGGGLERHIKVTTDYSGTSNILDLREAWLVRKDGVTTDVYAMADGGCVVEVIREGGTEKCQLASIARCTAAAGNYELAVPQDVFCVADDTGAEYHGGTTIKWSGTNYADFYLLTVERVLNAVRATEDRSAAASEAAQTIARLEAARPDAAVALRAGFNLPTLSAIRGG